MTSRIPVHTRSAQYDVVIGAKLLDQLGEHLAQLGVKQESGVFIVSDETLAACGHVQRAQEACSQAGYPTAVAVVPPGDESKSLSTAERLYNALLDAGMRRDGVLIALGGGVVGDLAGFVAATYQRGIRFIQAPTTLLSHDSSIGGKVGVNLPRGKNLVGAFHQPLAVLFDVTALSTLPDREWRNGMAEVIKHGVIGDAALFASLEANPVAVFPGETQAEELVARGAKVKIQIVEQDEKESSLRMLLNLGHTVGHAVEQASSYGLGHGEAVALGMRVEAEIAAARGWLSQRDKNRLLQVLSAHGLPIVPPDYPLEDILAILELDKKHTRSHWTFVLPRAIGDVAICRDVTRDEVVSAWHHSRKEESSQ